MRARDVVGRKIVGVHQERFWNPRLQHFTYSVSGLTLDDGTRIRFDIEETEDTPVVTVCVNKRLSWNS